MIYRNYFLKYKNEINEKFKYKRIKHKLKLEKINYILVNKIKLL